MQAKPNQHKTMKIGIIREGKVPPDSRVPLNPDQCAYLRSELGIDIKVQPSPIRVFKDEEYISAGIPIEENVDDCDYLLGVKEVPIDQLKEGKAYTFFSHTHKKQAYNRPLLQAVLKKKVQLIDYEVLTNPKGRRVIAFGYFAGVVGAHNGIWTYAQRTGTFDLPRMRDLFDYAAAKKIYETLELPPIKIVLTGGGRVGTGAADVLDDMGIRKVSPSDFLNKTYQEAVYTQLACVDYVEHAEGKEFDKNHFYEYPEEYVSKFRPYTEVSDLMINGIFWDSKSPVFFTAEDMASDSFNIKVIADVTCDIAPVSSIPSTLEASTIAEPVFGYDPKTGEMATPYQEGIVDMMTIDNLPSELPRDASTAFGKMFIREVIPHMLAPKSAMIERASIAIDGKLGPHFGYLDSFVKGEE